MNKKFAAAALAFAALSASAHAQLFRAYVSKDGNDANPCTLQQPCRLLPAALAAMADGGEIWMLDSANFNTTTVEIMKSVSILAVPGAVGSVVANGATAIHIATSGLKVSLRNIVVVPLPGTTGATVHGILSSGASTLIVQQSLIADMPGDGIHAVGGGSLDVTDSTLRGNKGFGIATGGGTGAMIARTTFLRNVAGGLHARAEAGEPRATLTLTECSLSGLGHRDIETPGDKAVFASGAGGDLYLTISRSTFNSFWAVMAADRPVSSSSIAFSDNVVSNIARLTLGSGGTTNSSFHNLGGNVGSYFYGGTGWINMSRI